MPLTLFGIRTRLWAMRQPKIDHIYYTNGGVGDELMLTAIAAAARVAGKPIHVIVTYPELWQDNTDAASIQTNLARWQYAELRKWIPTSIVHLSYEMGTTKHIAQQMADHANVSLPDNWHPVCSYHKPTKRVTHRIVFHNSCRGARYAASTKEWPQDRWSALIARLADKYEMIQIGSLMDPPMKSVEDRRGQTTLSGAAELIASARLFVGLESGLMHVAAAVHIPSVIIVGGRSLPNQTCYPFNHNITRTPDCVGCGLNDGCLHNHICLDISVEEVESAIHQLAASNSISTER